MAESNSGSEQQSPLPLLVPVPVNRHPHLEKHLFYRKLSHTNYENYFRRYHHQHFKIHLICYNILAQDLLEDNLSLYTNCFKNNIKWYRRQDRLLKELLRQDADILCLQEMQHDHYENVFRPVLFEYNYESIYLKRTGAKPDGCCIFYKINRLRLIQSKLVSFYQPNIQILDRDNCGLIALFQPLGHNVTSDDLFCVATTHLLFSPKRGDIKLAQIQYFLAEIDQLASKNRDTNSYYPIILCGDFNAQPQSPLIQFILNGYIKYNTYRCIEISGQLSPTGFSYPLPSNELLPTSFVTSDCCLSTPQTVPTRRQSKGVLTHNKQFKSVYDLNDLFGVTARVHNEINLVDYIFYTQQENDPNRLNLLTRLDLYRRNDMIDIHLPNHQFPSDHFLLSAKFALKLRK